MIKETVFNEILCQIVRPQKEMCPYNVSNFAFEIKSRSLIKLLRLSFILSTEKNKITRSKKGTDKAYLLMTSDKESRILLHEIASQELELQLANFQTMKKYTIM